MSAIPLDPELRGRIEDFLTEAALAVDDGEFARWPRFFTEDSFYQIIPRASFEAGHTVGIMTCRGRGMMQDRVEALQSANIYEPHNYCHILARPVLRREDDGAIAARTNFALYRTIAGGNTELFAAGKYLDRIVRDGDELRLQSRRVVLESRRVDILVVLPI
ncbi:MAG TPA: aromatic-ring-hydroxylating dioxygenase subunit beta [Stellaceae bacterium]|nr:aromatic-ring-hydroxylating dioxygenase subunit beta [Stellaceae bacterium]